MDKFKISTDRLHLPTLSGSRPEKSQLSNISGSRPEKSQLSNISGSRPEHQQLSDRSRTKPNNSQLHDISGSRPDKPPFSDQSGSRTDLSWRILNLSNDTKTIGRRQGELKTGEHTMPTAHCTGFSWFYVFLVCVLKSRYII